VELVWSMVGVLGVLCLGIMSPGPSFVLVARTAVAVSRGNGLATAVGMGVGGSVFAVLALLGLQAVLLSMPLLYLMLKVLGGVYLLYLAVMIWRGARDEIEVDAQNGGERSRWRQSFRLGLVTQLSNPKTAIFYGSVFAALLPAELPLSTVMVLAPVIFLLETGWYAIVAVVLSSRAPRRVYLQWKAMLDRCASSVIGILGLKLILDARSS